MSKTRFLGITALVLMGGLVTACDDDDDDLLVVDDRVDDLDLDDDAIVTRAEWDDAFLVWDVNGDGVLSPGEFRFNGGGFEMADIDADGFVSEVEWDALLDEWDLDASGDLDELEFDPFL